MKLKNIATEEDLYINREFYFFKSYHMEILDNKGKRIGDVFGYLIDTQKVANDIIKNQGSNFFIELDCESQLLCECAEYIIKKIPRKKIQDTNNILFLNRLSLDIEYISDENELAALDLLFEHAEMIIYSCGRTELDDDSPGRDNAYWRGYEKLLKSNDWKYSRIYDFYIKDRQDLWTRDKIMERLYRPFTSIKLKEEELAFWGWLFSDWAAIQGDHIIEFVSDGVNYLIDVYGSSYINSIIFDYNLAKSHLDIINKWQEEKSTILIEVSPFWLHTFIDYIHDMKEMREEDSIGFDDAEVENTIDKILNKYYKKFYKLRKDTYFNVIYQPMIERYFQNIDEFTDKRAQAICNDILKQRQKNK